MKVISTYLPENRNNKTLLTLAIILTVTLFGIFKYFYPFASYIHGDSFSYINAADKNLSINTYPIGYSKFLRAVSLLGKSDFLLTSIQYLILQSSLLFFLFTIDYIYKFSNFTKYLIFLFLTVNPLSLHLANLVSSDCLFLSISIMWITIQFWIFHNPSIQLILINSVVLFIAFTIRYNALIYPFLSLITFILTPTFKWNKMFGFTASITPCIIFIAITASEFKNLTGYWQFSPFSGWQYANNAMYAYRYVSKSERKMVPIEFHKLNNMVEQYFDSTKDIKRFPTEKFQASTFYMWSRGLPLMKYRDSLFINDTTASELKKWASMGPLYKRYGLFVIRTYPIKYINHFLWPNATKFFAPPIEFLKAYNTGNDSVPTLAKNWFSYKTHIVTTRTSSTKINTLDYYQVLAGISNILTLFNLIILVTGVYKLLTSIQKKALILGYTFWASNAMFTIFASSAALRFQAFPITFILTQNILLIELYLKHFGSPKRIKEIQLQPLKEKKEKEVSKIV